ncbi:MAG: glyoxalase superfamily protein [Pseudomonadota bacterium]
MHQRSTRTLEEMRRDAQALKLELRSRGEPAIHGHCIEAIARANGYRTWAAALVSAPGGNGEGAPASDLSHDLDRYMELAARARGK